MKFQTLLFILVTLLIPSLSYSQATKTFSVSAEFDEPYSGEQPVVTITCNSGIPLIQTFPAPIIFTVTEMIEGSTCTVEQSPVAGYSTSYLADGLPFDENCFFQISNLFDHHECLVLNTSISQVIYPNIGYPLPGIIKDVELVSAEGSQGVTHSGGLVDGASGFIDRNYEWINIPIQLVGADYIETAQNNAEVHPFALDVTVAKGTILHIIIPEHDHLLPFDWMTKSVFGSGWVDSGAFVGASWSEPAQVWSTITGLPAGTYRFRDIPLDPISGTYLSFYGIAATAEIRKKIAICHWQPDNFAWKLIEVGKAAVAGHFANHDDAFPGGTTAQSGIQLDENCEIALPPCGDCLESSGSPGCESGACTDLVCGIDPFCCFTFWDGLCAEEAVELCVGEVCQGDIGAICGIPKPLEQGICVCGFPELECTSTVVTCETSTDCGDIVCGGLPTCVEAGNDFPTECGPDNTEDCFYVE